jgi:hypothetical protein
MKDVASPMMAEIQKDVAVIMSDSSLGKLGLKVRDVIASGATSNDPAVLSASGRLEQLLDKIVKAFPNAEDNTESFDDIFSFFMHANEIYRDFAAAMHPYRSLNGQLWQRETGIASTADGTTGVNFGPGASARYPGTVGTNNVIYSVNTALGKNLNLANGNGAIAAVDTSSVIGDDKGQHFTEIHIVKGAGAIPTTYIPVVAIERESIAFNQDITVLIDRQDQSKFFNAVQDSTATNRTLNFNLGGPTSISVRHFTETGATVDTQTATLINNGT